MEASRLAKLRAMGFAEIAGRSTHELRVLFERWSLPSGEPETRLARSLRFNSEAGRTRFFAGTEDLQVSREWYLEHFREQADRSVARAARTLRHEFEVFGRTCALGPQIDWHSDPLTGESWPRVYHRDVPFGDARSRAGDIKYVWEINRHQHLLDLGKAWLLTGDMVYSNEIHAQVSSWIEANPYGRGVNWAGPLEVAYRALSWLWARQLIAVSPGDKGLDRRWRASLLDHGRFLHRHLEWYASPYNHLIGEAAVLFMLGVLLPEFREAKGWQREGRAVLEGRLKDQFHADGGSVEQATVYHHATLGFYLLAALIGRGNGQELAPDVWSAIERAIEFGMHLQQPDGRVPAIGDNDDARPIVFEWRSTWDFRHYQAMGAVLFDRPDFKRAAGVFHEEAFWILGPDGHRRFLSMTETEPPSRRHFERSGYVILRTSWTPHADYACFDCGELAGGLRRDDVPSAVHGHADCLSLVAWLGGEPVLVDSGFHTYNGNVEWERFFRETAAHSTVRIDKCDQARHLEKMAWCQAARVTVENLDLAGPAPSVSASHDGYARDPSGVTHTRTIWFRAPGCMVVCDRLSTDGEHGAEVVWQLAPTLEATLEPSRLTLSDRFAVSWVATTSVDARVDTGGEKPEAGWVSPHLGVRVPAPRLALSLQLSKPGATVLTVITDMRRWPDPPTSTSSRSKGLVVRLTSDAGCDTIVAPAGPGIDAALSDAYLCAWERRPHETLAQRVGGTCALPAEPT